MPIPQSPMFILHNRMPAKQTLQILKRLPAVIVLGFFLEACAAFHPPAVQFEKVMETGPGRLLQPGQQVKILSWNVQYMAGKQYVFFYDLPDGAGPDERPSAADIDATLQAVAALIRRENPDILLLQEIDDHARRTDYQDQLARLLALLPADYTHHVSAFYWKSSFVPHPRIMGAVGMKLSVVSKYKITRSTRHQLALREVSALRQRFELKRAVLETRLAINNGPDLVVLNTHLSAFAQQENTMQRQVGQIKTLLDGFTGQGLPWIIGGDFNLLPGTRAYQDLPDHQQRYYRLPGELEPLLAAYPSVPSRAQADSEDRRRWYTHFPNDPRVKAPDRIIDYFFYSPRIQLGPHQVIQDGALHISDHLPLVAEFRIPS